MKVTKLIALLLAVMIGVSMLIPAGAYDAADAQVKADALKDLGLFKGTNKGFELERAPTRLEAIIMLIRMTGKENEALYGEWEHPFTDAPAWEGASQYLGYAYENGLTTGETETTFNPYGIATAQMYITFMLRALGNEDTADATVWNNWEKLGKDSGILPSGVNTAEFTRGDAVIVSYAALSAKMTGADTTLTDTLLGMGTFNELTYAKSEIRAGKEVTSDSDLIDIAARIYLGSEMETNYLYSMEITEDVLPDYLGVTTLDYAEAIVVEPMMGSRAHSICVVRMNEGADMEKAAEEIKKNVDPRKWLCVWVEDEHVNTFIIDDVIILIMDNYDEVFLENVKSLVK